MGEKSEFAAKSSIAALQERALDIMATRPEGIYQSDLRRLLEIDSSKCSKVVSRLQGSGLIRRENVPASSTYLIKLSPDFVSSASTAAPTASPSNATALSPAIAPSPATISFASAAPSIVPNAVNQEENGAGTEQNKKQAAGELEGGIFEAHADAQTSGYIAQMNVYNADATAAIIESDLESLIQSNDDGRIKRMIDRQMERLMDRRISAQFNSRIQSSIGRIEDAIKSKSESNPLGKRSIPSPIQSTIQRELDGPMDSIETDRSVGSYFDCYIENSQDERSEEDLDPGGRIISDFDSRRFSGRQGHIDSYLTEIYLLYLTRASSFRVRLRGKVAGILGNPPPLQLLDGISCSHDRPSGRDGAGCTRGSDHRRGRLPDHRGGNVINDYYDRQIDAVNRPDRPIPSKRIQPRTAFYYSIILFAAGCLLAGLAGLMCLVIAVFNSILLFFYARNLKATPLLGNLSVSYLTGSTFLFGGADSRPCGHPGQPGSFRPLISGQHEPGDRQGHRRHGGRPAGRSPHIAHPGGRAPGSSPGRDLRIGGSGPEPLRPLREDILADSGGGGSAPPALCVQSHPERCRRLPESDLKKGMAVALLAFLAAALFP